MRTQLFFEMLKRGRHLKRMGWTVLARKGYLLGMWDVIMNHRDDFAIVENMRSYWANQNAGSEGQSL